ncbi:hypothetical protein WDW89_15260 [Deltaproteobacteria bacterium TL4]
MKHSKNSLKSFCAIITAIWGLSYVLGCGSTNLLASEPSTELPLYKDKGGDFSLMGDQGRKVSLLD